MALECAHCGTRCEDGAARCPKCLRATHLMPVPDAPAPGAKRSRAPAVVAVVLAAGAVGAFLALRRPQGTTAVAIPATVPRQANDPFHTGPELASVVATLRAERDGVARLRRAGELVMQRRQAAVAGEGDPVPPPRSADLVWAALPSARDVVTPLDLARLVAALLRAAGDTTAWVAERLGPARPDEPGDPTALLGVFVVRSGDNVLEPAAGTVVAASSVGHRSLDEASLAGAIAAQSALELATRGGPRDQALTYANAAVDAWPASPVPLLARARVWVEAGASSGLDLADSDLRSAIALRDDAATHLARARVLLAMDRLAEAASESSRASRMAPAWGTAGLAMLALHPVLERLDAGVIDGCAALRRARAPWTDDAYALCAPGVADDAKQSAAQRLFGGGDDPLRIAWALAALGPDFATTAHARLPLGSRRECARWLMLLGRAELAARVLGGADAGI